MTKKKIIILLVLTLIVGIAIGSVVTLGIKGNNTATAVSTDISPAEIKPIDGVAYRTLENYPSVVLTSRAMEMAGNVVSYTDPATGKTVYAFDGFIASTAYADWNDAVAFINELNAAEGATNHTKVLPTINGVKQTNGTWRLLRSQQEFQTWWWPTIGSTAKFDDIYWFWASPSMTVNGETWGYCFGKGNGGWSTMVNDTFEYTVGFVVVWEPAE